MLFRSSRTGRDSNLLFELRFWYSELFERHLFSQTLLCNEQIGRSSIFINWISECNCIRKLNFFVLFFGIFPDIIMRKFHAPALAINNRSKSLWSRPRYCIFAAVSQHSDYTCLNHKCCLLLHLPEATFIIMLSDDPYLVLPLVGTTVIIMLSRHGKQVRHSSIDRLSRFIISCF